MAILKTIQLARLHEHRKIVIFTDSLIACQLLLKKRTQNYIIADIHKNILEGDFDRVTLVWTPSHKGIPGNETADELAKNALNLDDEIHVDLTSEEALRSIKNEIYQKWYEEFLTFSATKPNLFSQIFTSRPKKTWFHNSLLGAKETKTINRILTGCTYDSEYLYRIKARNSNICRCGLQDSYIHQTFQCSFLSRAREGLEIFQENASFHNILHDLNHSKIAQLVSFFQKAEIKF